MSQNESVFPSGTNLAYFTSSFSFKVSTIVGNKESHFRYFYFEQFNVPPLFMALLLGGAWESEEGDDDGPYLEIMLDLNMSDHEDLQIFKNIIDYMQIEALAKHHSSKTLV